MMRTRRFNIHPSVILNGGFIAVFAVVIRRGQSQSAVGSDDCFSKKGEEEGLEIHIPEGQGQTHRENIVGTLFVLASVYPKATPTKEG